MKTPQKHNWAKFCGRKKSSVETSGYSFASVTVKKVDECFPALVF